MSVLSDLHPAPVWIYFEEICKIPRLSKSEEKIRKFLIEFARKNKLESKEDEVGNILISRPASPGMETRKTIVLQSHMDMVGEKNSDHPHNWESDPIVPVIKEGWVTASGTTLGADDGIGIAAQMAVLTDNNLKAGRIECLFTVDEETGMTGAINLEKDFFTGKILLNLDSEDEGILFIGCAGGLDTVGVMEYKPQEVPSDSCALEIALTGLHGGHSGDEIHKGYGNSVKIMNRIIRTLSEKYNVALANLDGGNLRNAIPRESFATVLVPEKHRENVIQFISDFLPSLKNEFGSLEKEINLTVKDAETCAFVIDSESQKKLIDLLECCPHGVLAWSKDMEDLVETSTNLASAKFTDNNTITVVTTQRSSVESARNEAGAKVASCMQIAGASITHSDGYPGWKPDLNSEILNITRKSYNKLFGNNPQVRAIHAGLECGLIYEKIKGIDMISFGPTIKGAHTPEEMIEIKTAKMFWDLLIEVIINIPEE